MPSKCNRCFESFPNNKKLMEHVWGEHVDMAVPPTHMWVGPQELEPVSKEHDEAGH